MTLTAEQCEAIRVKVMGQTHIPGGLGTEDEACSVAMINLALTGTLTDDIPECMSLEVGRWIIGVQDAMPDAMRNSKEWRMLLPGAAGTGREHEAERRAIILDWMWGTVLPAVQPVADSGGFGKQWRVMCAERTTAAANTAAYAAEADAANTAAVHAANHAANTAAYHAANTAAYTAAYHAANAANAAAEADVWDTFNPVALLTRLIAVSAKVC